MTCRIQRSQWLPSLCVTFPRIGYNFRRRWGRSFGEREWKEFGSELVMAKQVWLVGSAEPLARWDVPCLEHGLSSLFPIWSRRRWAFESECAHGLVRPSFCRKLSYRGYFWRFVEWLKHFKGRLYLRWSIVYDIGNNIVIIIHPIGSTDVVMGKRDHVSTWSGFST